MLKVVRLEATSQEENEGTNKAVLAQMAIEDKVCRQKISIIIDFVNKKFGPDWSFSNDRNSWTRFGLKKKTQFVSEFVLSANHTGIMTTKKYLKPMIELFKELENNQLGENFEITYYPNNVYEFGPCHNIPLSEKEIDNILEEADEEN